MRNSQVSQVMGVEGFDGLVWRRNTIKQRNKPRQQDRCGGGHGAQRN